MIYDDFFSQNNGHFVEKEDTTALNQCLDLIFAYCDALGIDRAAVRHPFAYQVWTNPTDILVQNFWYIPNTPNGVPQKGDIVIWGQGYNGGAGHIGICTGRADLYSLDCFEQNDPIKTPAHIKTYGYTNVLGWVRVKQPDNTSGLQQQINALQSKINAAKAALA